MNDESVKEVTNNSAIYMSIKKAFTPYGVLHMLRQLQMAHKLSQFLSVEEKYPLLFYTVGIDIPGSSKVTHVLKSQPSQLGMCNLTCTCPFFAQYELICYHQLYLLQKLQIKNINMFE